MRILGPGVLLAAASIGASHLLLAPRAGMLFGYDLLWIVLISHLFKYSIFEFGPRYSLATGESILHGYARLSGKSLWVIKLFVVFTALQGVGVGVAVASITGSVLAVCFGSLSVTVWSIIILVLVVVLLVAGGYPGMRSINKIMMASLALITIAAVIFRPPSALSLSGMFIPEFPAGGLVLAVAMIGWLPTGIDVSIWHSLWALESRSCWEKESGSCDEAAVAKCGMLDMRAGYVLSFVLAVFYLHLGTLVRIEDRQADGAGVAVAVSNAFTHSLGEWVFPLFMIAAFFAMFSTTYTVLDGFPRSLAEGLRILKIKAALAGPKRVYVIILACMAAGAAVVMLLWPKPVMLTTAAALLSFLVAPLYAIMNYLCITKIVPGGSCSIGRASKISGIAGAAFLTLASAGFIMITVWNIIQGPGS